MSGYYEDRLAADRLKRVYEVASFRVRRYLEAELEHLLSRIEAGDLVLDLGCGYGRTLPSLGRRAGRVIGIDNSTTSLRLAGESIVPGGNCGLAAMDAAELAFPPDVFDVVGCIQNGISAFHVDRRTLIRECVRVVKPGGLVLLSSYAETFWPDRLEWFERQADEGLLGEIDRERTGNGTIVCMDGFTATTVGEEEFLSLCEGFPVGVEIVEIDGSSLFCEIRKES
jgi:ubiquinone/menaquinone biosynthesis C-methylase UbiE